MTPEEEQFQKELLAQRQKMAAEKAAAPKTPIAGVKHVVAVYACKGGVGKTTVSVNLSVALAVLGLKVGLLDADVHGPNVPLMMGIDEKPFVSDQNRITPLSNYGVSFMSLGLLKEAKLPFIWRGPMVHGAVQQLLRDTIWGDLDILVIDCPPGTGDAQLTILQTVPVSGVIFVSTPQQVSLADGVKGINMVRKLNVPALGIIENMSGFECPHCHHVTSIFSKGGAQAEAIEFGIPFLGAIPLEEKIVSGSDQGKPIVAADPAAPASVKFFEIAKQIQDRLSLSGAQCESQKS